MLDKVVHALTPLAVIVCVTVLAALHVIDSTTALAVIVPAAGYGAVAVGVASRK